MSDSSPTTGHLVPPVDEAIFVRSGDFIVFNQLGVKLELDRDLSVERYYAWLDDVRARVKLLVPGAEIAEKEYARSQPRLNTGIYYDTPDRDLLRLGAVLRTTCNKITHAFCAFKEPESANGVRRDHRFVFGGEEKLAIQNEPTSEEAREAVRNLLGRQDIEHPGTHLRARYDIDPTSLTPSIRVAQIRRPFFVWLDKRDALRCVMDHADVTDLRADVGDTEVWFKELELPVYPRIEAEVASDPRTVQLIERLAAEAERGLGAHLTNKNKYQRAAAELGVGPTNHQTSS